MKILGISGLFHDASAALIINGEIVSAAQEERFTRKKHDKDFPVNAIRHCLEIGGITLDQVDAIAFYEKPDLKFRRLFDSYVYYAPKGFIPFLKYMPAWVTDKFFFKQRVFSLLKDIQKTDLSKVKLLFPEHHLSHAASTFYPSTFEESAILTIDGVGEWATASICYGKGNSIKMLKELHFPHSLGFLYSSFTKFLGFKVNNGEYKVMGLAPYGMLNSERVNRYVELIKSNLVHIADDGSVWLNQDYFRYAVASEVINRPDWEKLFGVPQREQDSKLEQLHCDLALAVQLVTEEVVLKMAKEAKRLTGSDNICLSGGVALNCVANGKLMKAKIFKNMYIQPASGDSGGSLGAALAAHHIYYGKKRVVGERDTMKGAYLGPEYSEADIKKLIEKHNLVYDYVGDENELCNAVAEHIASGNVIGWFQGRMEFGPRALGNRSILGDPTNLEMQRRINLKIKFREGFRPFAPSVLEEECQEYFNIDCDSPYMLLVTDIQENHKRPLPDDYDRMQWRAKLDINRSDIQAITHVNFSARIQTVTPESNRRYYKLINAFKKITGYGMLVNTSFNVRGEPIVCTPEDAYNCFMQTHMDYLVLDKYVFAKEKNKRNENGVQNEVVLAQGDQKA